MGEKHEVVVKCRVSQETLQHPILVPGGKQWPIKDFDNRIWKHLKVESPTLRPRINFIITPLVLLINIHVKSQIKIKYYSIAYFERITKFDVL